MCHLRRSREEVLSREREVVTDSATQHSSSETTRVQAQVKESYVAHKVPGLRPSAVKANRAEAKRFRPMTALTFSLPQG
jgi:hypothetical protein